MSQQQIPDMSIARGSPLGPPPGAIYSGIPQSIGALVAVAPPPVMPSPQAGRRARVAGLVPAQAGGMHPLVMREKPKRVVHPSEVSKARAALRRAEAEQHAAESAWVATAPSGGGGDAEKLRVAREALDRTAVLRRALVELEAAATSRPIAVVLATVREPSEVAEEGCKGHRWEDESALRRAHPTHAEMTRAQQCHVFAILCDAPLDPLDPDGEQVGYVAPVGRDGTTIARAAEMVDEATVMTAEEGNVLRAELAELRAMLAEAAGKKGTK
jgi:hypothetical protein